MQTTRCQKGKTSFGSVCHTCSSHSDFLKTGQRLKPASFHKRIPHFLKIQLLYSGSSIRLQTQLLKCIWGWTPFNVSWIQMVKCLLRSWVSALLKVCSQLQCRAFLMQGSQIRLYSIVQCRLIWGWFCSERERNSDAGNCVFFRIGRAREMQ